MSCWMSCWNAANGWQNRNTNDMSNLYVVIMAGGSGTRFWPRSRKALPKHHLAIAGQKTMIQQTLERLEGEVPFENILIVTIGEQVEMTREQLPELPPENIIAEPEGRNTAACVGLGASIVAVRGDDPMMLVVTADHVIQPKIAFWKDIRVAEELAEDGETLVIFGIKPTWGNPGFGYILRGEAAGVGCYQVGKFEEKPAPETAEQWATSGNYYWNSGMFVWKTSTILNELEQHSPDIFAPIDEIRQSVGTPQELETINRIYPNIPRQPIDKAVMEKAANVKVVEATFEWDDVGSWKALSNHHAVDSAGNTALGELLPIDSKGCIVAAEPGHLVAAVGVSDLIIVQTKDATLVCRKDDAERVKQVVEALEASGKKEFL